MTTAAEQINATPPASGMVLTRRPARKKGDLSPVRQLELLDAAQKMSADPASPDNGYLTYMANVLVRLTMPHKPVFDGDGKPATHFTREYNGLSITIQAHPAIGMPSGVIPRLLMSFITAEACRTKERHIELGRSLSEFLRKLGYASRGGGERGTATHVKQQLQRLFGSHISIVDSREDAFGIANMMVADQALLWWDRKTTDDIGLFSSTVDLSSPFFNELIRKPVPLDMRALSVLSGSPLALDMYSYLTWRMSHLRKKTHIEWRELQAQFGSGYPQTAEGLRDFRNAFRAQFKAVSAVYPEAKVDLTDSRHVVLLPSPTHVPMVSAEKVVAKLAKGLKSDR